MFFFYVIKDLNIYLDLIFIFKICVLVYFGVIKMYNGNGFIVKLVMIKL